MIYVIGSLKQDLPKQVARALREAGYEVFDDWGATGPATDKYWTAYEKDYRGRSYIEALAGASACNQFQFDYNQLIRCKAAVMVMPCGKSGHLELGWILGMRKPGFILLDKEPDEFELMYKLASGIAYDLPTLVEMLEKAGVKKEERG